MAFIIDLISRLIDLLNWRLSRKQTLVVVGIIAALGILSIIIGGYYFNWTWTGFVSFTRPKVDNQDFYPAKTVWDWMQLLIIPLLLAGGALMFNRLNTENQNELAGDNQREVALQTYIDRMSELLLDKELRTSKEDSEIRNIVRTRTLSVLRRLDGDRKAILLLFLQEAKLITRSATNQGDTIVDLNGADLSGADLSRANLNGANLSGANLNNALLSRANLISADLRGASLKDATLRLAQLKDANLSAAYLNHADLRGANLNGADLSIANLDDAVLRVADLIGADLNSADLGGADLRGANLEAAHLNAANLDGADLRYAILDAAEITSEQLGQAKSLKGAAFH